MTAEFFAAFKPTSQLSRFPSLLPPPTSSSGPFPRSLLPPTALQQNASPLCPPGPSHDSRVSLSTRHRLLLAMLVPSPLPSPSFAQTSSLTRARILSNGKKQTGMRGIMVVSYPFSFFRCRRDGSRVIQRREPSSGDARPGDRNKQTTRRERDRDDAVRCSRGKRG